jgi:hypothetical protein
MGIIRRNTRSYLTRTRWASHRVIETLLLASLIMASPACSSTDAPTAITVEDTELVGLWMGTVTGPFGGTVLMVRVRADSTLSVDAENPKYSRFDGVWWVADDCFMAAGSPTEGVVVTLVARAPFVRLKGTWTSNYSSGTFDLAKR